MHASPPVFLAIVSALSVLLASPSYGHAQALDGGRLFRQRCASCHAIEAGRNVVGPHLFAVIGRKAGSVDGARYSEAMRGAETVWDVQALDRFLASPRQFMPGTTMSMAVPNAGERKALIDYLDALR